jgi:hypothetical protein
VQQVENIIRRRLPVGSSVSVQRLREEVSKNSLSAVAIDRALYHMLSKEILVLKDRGMRVTRIKA